MDPRHLFVDERLTGTCVYCGGQPDTRDHVPSKAFLDDPLPPDLPVVEASGEVCDQPPFSSLKDLADVIDYRVTETQANLPASVEKPWLTELASGLTRIKLADDEQTERVRSVAGRLLRTIWQPFVALGVRPHIEGTPAGQAHSPDVLWQDEILYVRDQKLVKVFAHLAAELARPFDVREITDAIKACVERDLLFVREYLEENFQLAEDSAVPGRPLEDVDTDRGEAEPEPAEGPTEAGAEDELPEGTGAPGGEPVVEPTEPIPEPPPAPPRPPRLPEPKLIELYARFKGYTWDAAQDRYVHPKGGWLQRGDDSFDWVCYRATGDVRRRYWVSRQCLARGGIEVPANVWELLKQTPALAGIMLVDESGRPVEISGAELIRLEAEGKLVLFPATYRIRRSGSENDRV
jgi:hypothetical protein